MIKILATAEYKTEQYFSTARHFILDMFVPAWYPILSHLGTSLSVPVFAVPHLPILLGGPWMWKQEVFLNVSQNIWGEWWIQLSLPALNSDPVFLCLPWRAHLRLPVRHWKVFADCAVWGWWIPSVVCHKNIKNWEETGSLDFLQCRIAPGISLRWCNMHLKLYIKYLNLKQYLLLILPFLQCFTNCIKEQNHF